MARPCYVFDIDGTLADCSHRLHHIQKRPKDWGAFFAGASDDKPIDHVVGVCRALILNGETVVFASGRSDECHDQTRRWLDRHVSLRALISPLYMRRAGDHRDDVVVKMELLAQLRADGYEPIMVFDDRDRVVAAWRAAGVPCAQVAPGDF